MLIDKTKLDSVIKNVTNLSENDILEIDYLRNSNIDIDNSLNLLGDIDMYNETMNDFLNAINDHLTKLNNYKNALPNYAIEAYSIKSDAKYLGFVSLASIAYNHEMKAKE